ncbi:hypothetical protein [Filimonas effusa]|uniref:RHS repeat protein n=1 Tax=Filimonas effusa TaxID=2508721 RepID=A0A4Q1D277_9BACT|nr:hypothetical protein [Filimonas effusa]RXK81420.1 hypothetical protein ESB13_21030 [Filimonas effusa]
MRKMNIYLKLFAASFFFIHTAFSQTKYSLPQITPHSPNAASLGKYGDIPVSLQNGMVNMTIPLFSIKAGTVELPLALSYHNNGLKVDEIPSWVGLGWDLQCGGLINYQQRGNDDFTANGIFAASSKDDLQKYLSNQMGTVEQNHYFENLINGSRDGEYDFYTYNFLGRSGSFYFDKDQNIVTIPKSNLKITTLGSGNGFNITDEKGNIYHFTIPEYSYMGSVENSDLELRHDFSGNSSYLLGGIQTPEGRTISFGYQNYNYNYTRTGYTFAQVEVQPFSECPGSGLSGGGTAYQQGSQLLTTITFPEGSIVFEHASAPREDIRRISPSSLVPALSKVKLYNSSNELVKEFSFTYSYFDTNKRLRLDAVTQTGAQTQRWNFDYYDDIDKGFPVFFTNTKDHWGYYNKKEPAATNLPQADYNPLITQHWAVENNNLLSNRTSNYLYSRLGLLKQVKYPTGGTSTFNYEPNQFKIHDYSELAALSPFLKYDPNEFGSYATFISADTYTEPEVSGSFTFSSATTVRISANKLFYPESMIESAVSLGTSPGANDILPEFTYRFGAGSLTNYIVTLPAGTYYYSLSRNLLWYDLGEPETGSAWLTIDKISYPPIIPYQVGGCRISNVVHNDGAGNSITKRYEYADMLDSVMFRNKPDYLIRHWMKANKTSNENGSGWITFFCSDCGLYSYIHEESVRPMPGNSIDYKYARELDNDGSLGKTEYEFTVTENLLEQTGVPFAQPIMATWRAGLPKEKKIFSKTGGTYNLVKQETNVYNSSHPYLSRTEGIKVNYDVQCLGTNMLNITDPYFNGSTFARVVSNYQTENFYRSSANVTEYLSNGALSKSATSLYQSAFHTLPTLETSQSSNGTFNKVKTAYSFDYGTSAYADEAALGIKYLKDNNVLLPVEQLTIKTINGVDYVTAGIIYIYRTDKPVINKVYSLKINSPVTLTAFTTSSINGSGSFISDSRYEEKALFTSYDQYNNIQEMKYANNITTTYLWNYNNVYPVAEVTNANTASIAATSFEGDNAGNWIFPAAGIIGNVAITGKKAFNLNGNTIQRTSLNSTETYTLTYWLKNGSGSVSPEATAMQTVGDWTLYATEVTGVTSLSITGTGIIDELRLYPKAANMSTSTYEPLIGVTSQCDAANRITYYKYDEVGRLQLIRDQDGNILKKICYNYAGLPVACE